MVGMMVFFPLETLTVGGAGPGDLFAATMLVTSLSALRRERSRFYVPLALAMWVIFVGSLIASLAGLDFFSTSVSMIQETYLFLMFVTLVNTIKDRATLRSMVKIWAIVGAIEAVIIILDLFGIILPIIGGGNAKALALGLEGFEDSGRAVGTFRNANAAGGYMMLTLFALLAVSITRKVWVRWGLAALYGLAILATGSVGAMGGASAAVIVALLYWLHRQGGRAILFGVGLTVAVAVIVGVLTPIVLPFVSSAGKGTLLFELGRVGHKLDKRLALWARVPGLMANYPLGIGPNVTATIAIIGAHSDYVAFFSERGQIGIIGFFLLHGEIVFALGVTVKGSRNWQEHLATGALLGGLLGLMIMGVVHETFHGRPVWLMFVVIFVHYKLVRSAMQARLAEASRVQLPPAGMIGQLAK